MKLEDQVPSLELSKKLKELGVRQESLFYWIIDNLDIAGEPLDRAGVPCVWYKEFLEIHEDEHGCGRDLEDFEHYSAFTVAELGELLPHEDIWYGPLVQYKSGKRQRAGHGVWYDYGAHANSLTSSFDAATEADARAKMLIYLIESDSIKP